MSLPASLTTDCGGLLNRRSHGRKRCCHTGLFTRDIRFTLHTDGSCPELSNLRIGLFSHGASRRSRSYCPEFANCRIFFTRRIAESHGVLSRDLSFGPTDQREVIIVFLSSHGESRRVSGFMSRIIELLNFFSHGESRRFSLSRDMFLVTNLRDLSLDPLTNGK